MCPGHPEKGPKIKCIKQATHPEWRSVWKCVLWTFKCNKPENYLITPFKFCRFMEIFDKYLIGSFTKCQKWVLFLQGALVKNICSSTQCIDYCQQIFDLLWFPIRYDLVLNWCSNQYLRMTSFRTKGFARAAGEHEDTDQVMKGMLICRTELGNIPWVTSVIIAHQRSCKKVMFSVSFVCLFRWFLILAPLYWALWPPKIFSNLFKLDLTAQRTTPPPVTTV